MEHLDCYDMKLLGIFLIVVGVVVGLQFVLEPILHTSTPQTPYSPNWTYINYGTLLAIIIGLIVSYLKSKESKKSSQVCSTCTRNNIYCTGFFVLFLLFIWNFAQLYNESYVELATTRSVHSLIWVIIDVSVVLLSISLGKDLLRSKPSNLDTPT